MYKPDMFGSIISQVYGKHLFIVHDMEKQISCCCQTHLNNRDCAVNGDQKRSAHWEFLGCILMGVPMLRMEYWVPN